MGFLDRLFKPKPREEKVGGVEKQAAEAVAGGERNAVAPHDPGEFLHPKRIAPASVGKIYRPAAQGVPLEWNPARTPPVAREIVITLGDVLSLIPTQLLHTGFHDAKRELRFSVDELSADIARGRAAVPLSKIAALCPDVFIREIAPADDTEVRLPLQKLVEQIGLELPLPLEEILKNLPIPPEPAPLPVPAADAAAGQAGFADFLAGAEDQSLAPANLGAAASEAPGDPPGDPPDPSEVAAQTPPETPVEVALPAYAPAAAVDPVIPPLHIFTPPPPVVLVAPAAPPDYVIRHLEHRILLGVSASTVAMPAVHIHPPPAFRPALVNPPPILPAFSPPVVLRDPDPVWKVAVVTAAEPPSIPQEALQTLFMTDEPLTLAAICRLASALPGVQACALDRGGETANAGTIPGGVTFTALHAAAARLGDAASDADPLALGTLQTFTLHGDRAAISLFVRAGVLLAVWHRALPPGVRERLATVADELARGV